MARWIPLVTLSLSMFIIVVDTTVMNVSISALIVDLDTTVAGIQSAIALYALVMAAFMLVGGKLGDTIGPKKTFVIGLCVFGVGTALASVSQSLGLLLVGWSLIEGLGAALMMPNIQTILRAGYTGRERALAYSVVSAVGAVGAALGPIIGGYLTTFHSWRWAFRLEVLIVIAVLILARSIVADARRADRPPFDIAGAVLSVLGWSAIVLGILLGQAFGYVFAKQPLAIGGLEIAPFGLSVVPFLIGVGVLLIAALFDRQSKLEQAGRPGLFKASLFSIRGLPVGFATRFVQLAVTAAFLFTMPLLLQLSFDYTAMQTGIALIPFSLALLVAALLGARLSARFSARLIIRVGYGLAILGLVLVAATVRPDSGPEDLALGAVFGAGIGLVASQLLNLVLSLAPAEDTPEVSGLNGTFEQLGNAAGVALIGSFMILAVTAASERGLERVEGLSPAAQVEIAAAIERGVALISDAELAAGLEAAGAGPDTAGQIMSVYGEARVAAFRAGFVFLVVLAGVGFILARRLPDARLV